MIVIRLPNSLPIVIVTSSAAGTIRRLCCVPLAALSHTVKSAKLNWFHLVVVETLRYRSHRPDVLQEGDIYN